MAEEKQLFHCFSCGRGGNVFNFMQELENLSFPESVVRVAELSNIDIDVELPTTQTIIPRKEKKLYEAHEKAAEFYSHVLLNTKGGKEALDYLENRRNLKRIRIWFFFKRQNTIRTSPSRITING